MTTPAIPSGSTILLDSMTVSCINGWRNIDLPSFPDHKHLPDRVVAAAKPALVQVIEEAAALAWPESL